MSQILNITPRKIHNAKNRLDFGISQSKRIYEISHMQTNDIDKIAKLQEAYNHLLACAQSSSTMLEKIINNKSNLPET